MVLWVVIQLIFVYSYSRINFRHVFFHNNGKLYIVV